MLPEAQRFFDAPKPKPETCGKFHKTEDCWNGANAVTDQCLERQAKQILQQLFEKPKEYHSTKHVMSWEPSNEYPNKKRTRLQRNPKNNQGKTTTRRLR